MERVRKMHFKNKEILIVDFSESKTDKMIEIFNTAKHMILTENKQVLIVSIFRKNYITSDFMRHLEKEIKEVEIFVSKRAITGLSDTQKWIVKGLNLWYKRKLYHFDSLDEALEYLSAEDKTVLN